MVPRDAAPIRARLSDARLRIPVLESLPEGARALRVPANFVVHRGLFKSIFERDARDRTARANAIWRTDPIAFEAPYVFAPLAVVDAASAREAERLLFRALRKPQDGWTSRYLNRYISLAISRWLRKNAASIPIRSRLGFWAWGVAGAWLASRGGYGNLLMGARAVPSAKRARRLRRRDEPRHPPRLARRASGSTPSATT